MARHVKTDDQRITDRERQKQLAVLWRAQEIYRLANEACEKYGAYKDDATGKQFFFSVLNTLDDTRKALKELKAASSLKHRKDVLNEVKPGPTNCTTDADCPEDYVCDEKQCWYMYSDV